MGLAFFFAQTGSTANDLLKLCHRANHFIQDNQLCHLAIRTRGEQLGSSCNDRVFFSNRDKIIQLALSISITACNANNIIGILLHHVGILVCQRHPHTLCCFFGWAKYDGLSHAVSAFQVSRDFSSNLIDTILYNNVVVVIAICINAIFDFVSVNIALALARTPSLADVRHDIDYLERCKETILNSFFQAVSIDWFAKIIDVRNIFGFFWRSSHADLRSRSKIFQNFAPVAFFLRRSTVTLIDNNQVKEIRAKEL